jgi:putative glutamine amidotransferase
MKAIIPVLLLFAYSCNNIEKVSVPANQIVAGEKHIILMHPTVNNIKTFNYLVNNKIFPLPKDYKVIGVYHAKEEYKYKASIEYLKKQGLINIILFKIDAPISDDMLYKHNACSDTYKYLFENSNGAISLGGPDIPPACYGEKTSTLTSITDPFRHYMEISFLFHLLGGSQDTTYIPLLKQRPDYPILAICLGMQSINVATGGTLYQDIPSEIYNLTNIEDILKTPKNKRHRNYNVDYILDTNVTYYHYHQIAIEKGSLLSSYTSNDTIHPVVWSSHHQSIEKLGKGLQIAAKSMDGKIVEAITHANYPNLLGVQFHPEKRELYNLADKIMITPSKAGEYSYLNLYSGDKGENFQREIWRKFAEKFK